MGSVPTWDRLVYPLGPPEVRLEVEAQTEASRELCMRL